jgi:ATP-dependent DNA helicase RecQ
VPRNALEALIAIEQLAQEPLFDRLKALRRALADRQGVPAFVVFSDATRVDMARRRPRMLEELALVSGVGPKKLASYGEAFLRVLCE